MRPLIAMMLTGGLAIAGIAVPVLTLPVAAAEPVEAELTSIPLDGIDSEALQDPSVDDTPEQLVHGAQAESDLAALSALEHTGSFMAAGVTWDAETPEEVTEVSVRVLEDGDWGPWESLEISVTT